MQSLVGYKRTKSLSAMMWLSMVTADKHRKGKQRESQESKVTRLPLRNLDSFICARSK